MAQSRANLTPRAAAVRIITELRQGGYVAYLAGGCVRDRLLGHEPKDYDVATDAPPDVVQRTFRSTQAVGEAFGVILVKLGGQRIEVATFRDEFAYEDGRRPSRVEFCNAERDAQRRDFTINGLFEDPLAEKDPTAPAGEGESVIVDYVGGRADLAAGVVRAIGDPHQRFAEDYLRMLRAPRFAARLGFEIEAETSRAIVAHASKLADIARERIGGEVRLMLTGARPQRAAALMQSLQLDAPTLDEAHVDAPLPTLSHLDEHGVAAEPVGDNTLPGSGAQLGIVLAAWAMDRHVWPREQSSESEQRSQRARERRSSDASYDTVADRAEAIESIGNERGSVGAATLIARWRRALCLSNEERDAMRTAFALTPSALRWSTLTLSRRKRLLAEPLWPVLSRLAQAVADAAADGATYRQGFVADVADLCRGEKGPIAPEPLVTGEDLIALGQKPGPTFARLLEKAYDAQLECEVHSKEDALELLKEWMMGNG